MGSGATGRDGGGKRFPQIEELRAYWEALRQNGQPPLRADIDPRGIANALAQTFILDRVAPGIGRFRLAGMHIVDLMGMEVRGMVLSSLIDPAQRHEFALALEQVFSNGSVLEASVEAQRGIGKPALAGRLLILPLRIEARDGAQAIGCLATEGAVGRPPRAFTLSCQLVSRPAAKPIAERVPGFAEPRESWNQMRPTDPRRAHLRLVKS